MKKRSQNRDPAAFDAAVQALAANLIACREGKGLRSFVFCPCGASVRVGTLTRAVAASLGTSGWRTLLIDADADPGLAQPANGLYGYLHDGAELRSVLQTTQVPQTQYLPGGRCSREERLAALSAKGLDRQLEALCAGYDFVLLAVPPYAAAPDGKLLAQKMDATLLVAAVGQSAFSELETAHHDFTAAGAAVLGVVVTQLRDHT